MKTAAIVFALVAIVLFAIGMEIAVWNECRDMNSFLYCLRVMSK